MESNIILSEGHMPMKIIEDQLIPPEELTEDEANTIDFLSNSILDSISLPSLSVITAEEMFGDKISNNDESLFLSAMIDETQPLQSELVARLHHLFDAKGYTEPNFYSYQLFKRKAGFSTRDKRLASNSTSENQEKFDLSELGTYCSAVCLNEYQVVKFGNDEHLITAGNISPVFELKPHTGDKKAKPAPRPSVPFNRTQVLMGKGRATIKTKKYTSVLVWAFWDSDPTNKKETEIDTSSLEENLKGLLSTVSDQSVTIHDSVEEAKRERDTLSDQ